MSTQTLRLLLRVDATPTTGLGHAVRMAGIAAEIPKPLALTVVGNGESLRSLFPDATISPPRGLSFPVLAAADAADGIIVDLPAYDEGMWKGGNGASPPVVAIDDYGGPVKADLIINGTVLDEFHHYPAMNDATRLLTGPRYSLVRPAFGRTPWKAGATSGVLIVAGSGPRAREWTEMLMGNTIDRSAWGPVTVIVGQTFARIEELYGQCERVGVALKIDVTADVLAGYLASASVALITGGMIAYEALAVGVPSVVMPQLENCIAEVKWFADQGCIHDLGFDAGMNPANVSRAVARLLTDRALANDMSDRSRRLIDGKGMTRAATAIAELIQTSARLRKQ